MHVHTELACSLPRIWRDSVTKFSTSGIFSSNNTPGSTDSWAKAVSNIESYSLKIFDYENWLRAMLDNCYAMLDNRQFSISFNCHGVGKTTDGSFLLYCCFNDSYKSRKLVFWLCAVQKNARMHSAEFFLFFVFFLSATPRFATQCEIQAKNFLVDFALCCIGHSRLLAVSHSTKLRLHAMHHCLESLTVYLRTSLWIRIHTRKWFNPLISDQSGIEWWKKLRIENLMRLSL
jgi:hypothetical protein